MSLIDVIKTSLINNNLKKHQMLVYFLENLSSDEDKNYFCLVYDKLWSDYKSNRVHLPVAVRVVYELGHEYNLNDIVDNIIVQCKNYEEYQITYVGTGDSEAESLCTIAEEIIKHFNPNWVAG